MVWNQLDVSEDTRKMLNELVVRKKKMERLKLLKNGFSWITMLACLYFAYYFYIHILQPSHNDMMKVLAVLFNGGNLALLLFAVTSFLLMNSYTKAYTKHKAKYESLRAEAIEFMYVTWVQTKNSIVKDAISKDLKETYDINLTYKS